jgi:hypothetical protein
VRVVLSVHGCAAAITRLLGGILGGQTTRWPPCCCSCWLITAVLPSRSHIAPPQPGCLAAAQVAQRDQVVGGVPPVAFDGAEERGGLRGDPHGGMTSGDLPHRHHLHAVTIMAIEHRSDAYRPRQR